jgi:hypothetical protein
MYVNIEDLKRKELTRRINRILRGEHVDSPSTAMCDIDTSECLLY